MQELGEKIGRMAAMLESLDQRVGRIEDDLHSLRKEQTEALVREAGESRAKPSPQPDLPFHRELLRTPSALWALSLVVIAGMFILGGERLFHALAMYSPKPPQTITQSK